MQEFCVDGSFNGPWCNRVDGDLARSELDSQVSCEHFDCTFACAIGGKMRERQFFMHRADVDDFSRAAGLAKVAHYRLRHKEHALQVDVQDGVEVRFGDVPEIGVLL